MYANKPDSQAFVLTLRYRQLPGKCNKHTTGNNLYLFSIFEGVKEVGVQSACRTGMPIVLTASVSKVISDNS